MKSLRFASFDAKHGLIWIFRETIGDDKATDATPNDDIVIRVEKWAVDVSPLDEFATAGSSAQCQRNNANEKSQHHHVCGKLIKGFRNYRNVSQMKAIAEKERDVEKQAM